MKEILLSQGRVALVDDDVCPYLSRFRWFAFEQHGIWYARRNIRKPDGQWTSAKMHRDVLRVPTGVKVDHIDHNGLNNCRSNLRACSNAENLQNGKRRSSNTSGYKGVSFHRKLGKWQSNIRAEGKLKYLGVFSTPELAAQAYDDAARHYFGEFAALNFPLFDLLEEVA